MNDGGVQPRCATAGQPTVAMRAVRALIAAVEQAGVPCATLLHAAGIEAEQLENMEARLPRAEVYRICAFALELTGDPALGLHWSERLTVKTFAPISYLMAHSVSLSQGFASLLQFQRLLSDDLGFELLEHADKVTLRCSPQTGESIPIQRFVAEMTLGSFFHIFRAFAAHAQPERVSFAYAAPIYRHEYTRVFGQRECFDQPFTEIVFDRALLNAPSPNDDRDIHEALTALAERRLTELNEGAPFALRVREVLVQRGWPERIDMSTVARALGLSVRSLRRRLTAEGKSYNDLENDAFAIVATHLLRDKQRTIQQTADEMGFSDATTFHRAFKRATGTTPTACREKPRGNAAD